MEKECLTISLQSHYLEERDNMEKTLTRKQWRTMLYAFGRPLVPLWTDEELYESIDEFLDSIEF